LKFSLLHTAATPATSFPASVLLSWMLFKNFRFSMASVPIEWVAKEGIVA
jgi:hypothetical protein